MTPTVEELARRAKLAADVYAASLDASDTFEEIGGDLAYLMGAILNGYEFDEAGVTSEHFMPLLREHFEPSHEVWASIVNIVPVHDRPET
jgi:hypothetical protein